MKRSRMRTGFSSGVVVEVEVEVEKPSWPGNTMLSPIVQLLPGR